MIGDPELKSLKKGDIIQLQRKGFYIVDVAYSAESESTDKVQPIILFSIPDGHAKDVHKQSNTVILILKMCQFFKKFDFEI